MKRRSLSLLLFSFFLFGLPSFVFAAGGLNVSTRNVNLTVGQSSTVTITASNAAGRVDISTSGSAATVSGNMSAFLDNSSTSLTISARSAGTTTITVKASDMATYDMEVVNTTYTITVNVSEPVSNPPSGGGGTSSGGGSSGGSSGGSVGIAAPVSKSSNNNLSALSVSGCSLSPAFNANTTSYTCSEVDGDSITINAMKADSQASVSGTGRKGLNYGSNTLTVTVTAGNGSRKNYTIQVNRTDNRNNDNSLSALGVLGHNISFDPDVYEYHLKVAYTSEEVTVNATPSDGNAVVTSGVGAQPLNVGDNTIEVVVQAENGELKSYYLYINRSEEENIPSTNLINMEINGQKFDVTKLKSKYLIGIESDKDSLDINLETSSKTTEYKINGNENLVEGINIVNIVVSDTDCEDSAIALVVYKEKAGVNVISSLNNFSMNGDVVYRSNRYQEQVLTKDAISVIKDSDKDFYYNVINENGGLYYSFIFNKAVALPDELVINFVKSNTNPYTYTSNLPKGVIIKCYLDDEFDNGDTLHLYSYDQKKNRYILLNDIKVSDGYVSFESDGSTQYVFSKDEIHVRSSFGEWIIRVLFLILGSALLLSGYVFYLYMSVKDMSLVRGKVQDLFKVSTKSDVKVVEKPVVAQEVKSVEPVVTPINESSSVVVSPSVIGNPNLDAPSVPHVTHSRPVVQARETQATKVPVTVSAPKENTSVVGNVRVVSPSVAPAQLKKEPVLSVNPVNKGADTRKVQQPSQTNSPVMPKVQNSTNSNNLKSAKVDKNSSPLEVSKKDTVLKTNDAVKIDSNKTTKKEPVVLKPVVKVVEDIPVKKEEKSDKGAKVPNIDDVLKNLNSNKEDKDTKKSSSISIENSMDNEPVGRFSQNPGIIEIHPEEKDIDMVAEDSMDNELP